MTEEESKEIIDDSGVIDVEVVVEQTKERTQEELDALPYMVTANVLTTLQKTNRTIHLNKTMKEKFNVPAAKWKRFLHPSIREKFMKYLRETGSLTGSLVKLRTYDRFEIGQGTVHTLLSRFPTFHMMYEEAINEYGYTLEAEAHRRAVDGTDEDVYHQGEVCGTKKHYSDNLLSKLMEANIRKYKKTGAGGNTNIKATGQVQVNINTKFGD